MKMMKHIGVALLLLLSSQAWGQKFSLATNALDYANFGTLNLDAEYAVSRKWSIGAGAKYNPFSFENSRGEFRSRQQTYSLRTRFWPWHTYSGWWISGKVQYQEYNVGGILSERTEEGDRFGLGVSAGYTYMLHPNLNLEFGLGIWAGVKDYAVYTCPTCGLTEERGIKGFILPNDIIIGISYVF